MLAVLVGWGVLLSVGAQYNKVYALLGLEPLVYSYYGSRMVTLLVMLASIWVVFGWQKNLLSASFAASYGAAFGSLLIVGLRFLPFHELN